MPIRGLHRGSRGRGGRGRGGRGRGRGRGGRQTFDGARLAEKDASDSESESGSDNNVEDLSLSDAEGDENSSDDDAAGPEAKPYAALMQSLAEDAGPQAKKRKLDHQSEKSKERDDFVAATDPDVDVVDEDEEGPETAMEGVLDEDDENDDEDPFKTHFADPDDNLLSRRLKAIQDGNWSTHKSPLPRDVKAIRAVPGADDGEEKRNIPSSVSGPDSLKLKQKLAVLMAKQRPSFDEAERYLAACIFSYQDLLYCERTVAASNKLRRLACLHAVNHVFKTRDRVIKNNAKLAKEGGEDLELRDQGFTRPKVLMILPTREACVRMIKHIIALCEPDQQENRKRFDDTFIERDAHADSDKPDDFKDLFAGNDDDMFRLGLKFTRKTVKFFSQFYNSDIILASPLGLRMAIGSEGSKKIDCDFLSSVEVVVVDQAEALLMQNWDHMEFIFEHMNLQPKEAHGCDFSRVRSWYLDNQAAWFRQTITLSAFNTPELNTLFFNQSKNWAGKIKIQRTYPGAIQELGLKVRQTFSRLDAPSFQAEPDARFSYFTSSILPSLTKHARDASGTLIFIPSYLDFVRVRNHFLTAAAAASLSFAGVSEYSSSTEVARARSHFVTGRHHVLLYTERAHHFRRYRLKGVRRLVLYGLPDNPLFFRELVDDYLARSVREGLVTQPDVRVRVVFSKWDVLKLERVVGTERVARMLRDKGDTFDFV